MDKDRIEGSAKQAKGAIKEVAGKLTGDAKLQADGKADKAAGKIQNAIRGVNPDISHNIGASRRRIGETCCVATV
jgi:uncharacterized protein YjbJ (UPF0337 family)